MRVLNLEIIASRWPWQKDEGHWASTNGRYGWRCKNPLGRFGGGWTYKLGFAFSGQTLLIDLLFGSIRISAYKPKATK